MHHQALADGQDTLLGPGNATLEHQEVILHDTVMREAAERGDGLVGGIRVGRTVVRIVTKTDAVDLLVELCAVVVTV